MTRNATRSRSGARPGPTVGEGADKDQRLAELAAAVEQAAAVLASLLDNAVATASMSVSPTQLRVLTLINANPRLNVNRLAEALQVGPSSASRMCDRLEALGLLSREPDPRDRREVQLRMTTAATHLLGHLTRRRQDAVAQVLARMPETARGQLVRSLTAFSQAIRPQPADRADEHTA